MARGGYGDVVLAAPVTVPYVRYSIRGAHWFLGRAVAELLAAARIPKAQIDGLAVASFTLSPDTAVGLTQHLDMTVRWLDHVPMGGASGIVSIRRAARAVGVPVAECGEDRAVLSIHSDGMLFGVGEVGPVANSEGEDLAHDRVQHLASGRLADEHVE